MLALTIRNEVRTLQGFAKTTTFAGERWHVGKARVVNRVEMEPDTEVSFAMPVI